MPSSTVPETTVAERFLVGTLRGAALSVGSRVYNEVAPPAAKRDSRGQPQIYVIVRFASGADVRGVGANRQAAALEYVVEAITEGLSYDDVSVVAGEIDAALQGAHGAVPGAGTVLGVTRTAPWKVPGGRDGVDIVRLGGKYRVVVKSM